MPYSFSSDRKNIFFRCVEDSSEAIMISDVRGKLVYVNPAWTEIYGYSKEEAIGQTPRLLHSSMQSDEFYREMWSRILNPKIASWKGELVNRTKDGKLVPVLLTITPFRSSETDEISGFMGIAVDITQRRELEAKVAHQDRLASIGLLSSGLAHEIGTPLGVIRGRAELMMMRTDDEWMKRSLSVITSEIDRISKLIRSLLRVSRSSSDVHMESLSPTEVINEVLSLVGQNLRDDRIELRAEVSPEIRISADFGRLEQIFLNFIMNSIHAIRKARQGGREAGHFLAIRARKLGADLVEIDFEDSGCGISSENMKKLFKPFYTTKDIGEGTGLGLAIVAQLIREMNGQVSVASVVDQGTTFTLKFQSTPTSS
jgi:two-component system cell cycle sensor histidine kinase/response regulator CckA